MRKKVLILVNVLIVVIITWKSCRYDWNPHYAENKAVTIEDKLYNADSSVAVVKYTLDIRTRGVAAYQALLRPADYKGDLSKFMLPVEFIEPKWRGLDTLEVTYDEAEAFLRGGNTTQVQKERNVVMFNNVIIIVRERRLNKQQMIENYLRDVRKRAK